MPTCERTHPDPLCPTDVQLATRNLSDKVVSALPLRAGLAFCALCTRFLGGCFARVARHVVQRGFETGFEVDETSAQGRNLSLAARVRQPKHLQLAVSWTPVPLT